MDPVIKIENLSKKYILNHLSNERYTMFRDVIAQKFKKKSKLQDQNKEEFWALDDISLDIQQSDKVGIVGRNGAGKSTLLKVLSRITEPTKGKISIRGRVASLLEVGTGFHPELTGRENIFLNGAVLGMTKTEINKKYDEIVAFAEVEKFLDTPVKRFSSGMQVRLAFAVAAHLEPEILIADEVLAVGDAQFQKKCLGRMSEISNEGRTIIFVSHNMAAVKTLCNKGVVLDKGKICFLGTAEEATEKYIKESISLASEVHIAERERNRIYPLWAKIVDLSLITEDDEYQNVLDSSKPFKVKVKVHSEKDINEMTVGVEIADHNRMISSCHSHYANQVFDFKKGLNEFECYINPSYLTGGEYYLNCAVYCRAERKNIDFVENAFSFTVMDLDPYNYGFGFQQKHSIYHIPYEWNKIS